MIDVMKSTTLVIDEQVVEIESNTLDNQIIIITFSNGKEKTEFYLTHEEVEILIKELTNIL